MLAQLVEDLVHLERGEDRLDQHGGLDRAARDAEVVLRHHEDVVPQARLEMALELRQVEVRARAAREQAPSRCGRRTARSRRCRRRSARRRSVTCFSGRCQPRGRTNSTAVFALSLYALPSGEVKSIVRRTASHEVDLALDVVVPARRVGVLEVRHEDAGAGVERVDDHLAVDRAGDLDAAVGEVGRHRRARPVGVADRARLGQEIGKLARVELGLARRAAREELGATAAERALQLRRERDRLGRQDLRVIGRDAAGDLDAGAKRRGAHRLRFRNPGLEDLTRPRRAARDDRACCGTTCNFSPFGARRAPRRNTASRGA